MVEVGKITLKEAGEKLGMSYRRGRTAGLPGNVISFILCALIPPIPLGRNGVRSGQRVFIGILVIPILQRN